MYISHYKMFHVRHFHGLSPVVCSIFFTALFWEHRFLTFG